MLRTFVVPLDGSDLAERALPYARQFAEANQGRLILMHAALAAPPVGLDGADWESEQLAAIHNAEAYLRSVGDTIKRVPFEIAVPYSHASQGILDTVDQYAADAIVMATHGRTGLAHLLYGSVTEAVLSESKVPVLVTQVRPGEAPMRPFEPTAARLLVPLDGSAFDEPTLCAAVQVLGERGEVTLVTVVAEPDHVEYDDNGRALAYLDQQEEARTRDAREYLAVIARELQNQVPSIRVKVDVRVGEPADGIAMAARAMDADLIVMSTHGRTGIRRAVMGSVTGAVLRTGAAPVLLVHPTAGALQSAEAVGAGAVGS